MTVYDANLEMLSPYPVRVNTRRELNPSASRAPAVLLHIERGKRGAVRVGATTAR